MNGPQRVTTPTLQVLDALVKAHTDGVEIHGWALAKATGLSGPTIYGVLDRLEDSGWLAGRWQDSPVDGRPRRRVYSLTDVGISGAQAILASPRNNAVPPKSTT